MLTSMLTPEWLYFDVNAALIDAPFIEVSLLSPTVSHHLGPAIVSVTFKLSQVNLSVLRISRKESTC